MHTVAHQTSDPTGSGTHDPLIACPMLSLPLRQPPPSRMCDCLARHRIDCHSYAVDMEM